MSQSFTILGLLRLFRQEKREKHWGVGISPSPPLTFQLRRLRAFQALRWGKADEEKLAAIVSLIAEDLGTAETSVFFPELWALANHNETAAQEMKRLYDDARCHIVSLIRTINPKLDGDDAQSLGLFISASLEGQTPFFGFGRSFSDKLPFIRNIAAYAFVELVKNIRPKDIRAPQRQFKKLTNGNIYSGSG